MPLNRTREREPVNIVDGSAYLKEIRDLILEYAHSLRRDLSFQGLEDEIAHLEDKYLPPHGALLAAKTEQGRIIGCVALYRHSARRCEMKRLYVKPGYQGLGIGQLLAESIIALAREQGYVEMVLDTLSFMHSAIALYKKLGFCETDAWYKNPLEDALYLKLALS